MSSFAPGVSLGAGTVTDLGLGTTLVDLRALMAGEVTASSANGIILTAGGKNEDNVASYTSNEDGTFTVFNRDNLFDGTQEQDSIAFVFLPLGAVATDMSDTLLPFGRFDADGSRILGQGQITAVRDGSNDRWTVTVSGQTPNTGTLLVAKDEDNNFGFDNFITARASGSIWIVEHWDIDGSTVSVKTGLVGSAFSMVFLPDAGVIFPDSDIIPTLTEWGVYTLIPPSCGSGFHAYTQTPDGYGLNLI